MNKKRTSGTSTKAGVDDFLKEKSKMLGKRLETSCGPYPEVQASKMTWYSEMSAQTGAPVSISVYMCFPYDGEKHEGRDYYTGSEGQRLTRLKLCEANVLAAIAGEIAGDEFDVNLVEILAGQFEYSFIPHDLPK